jgi:hypothetical protein
MLRGEATNTNTNLCFYLTGAQTHDLPNVGKKVTRKSHRKKVTDKKSQEIKSQEKKLQKKKVNVNLPIYWLARNQDTFNMTLWREMSTHRLLFQ